MSNKKIQLGLSRISVCFRTVILYGIMSMLYIDDSVLIVHYIIPQICLHVEGYKLLAYKPFDVTIRQQRAHLAGLLTY